MNNIWKSIDLYNFFDNYNISEELSNKLSEKLLIAKNMLKKFFVKNNYKFRCISVDKYSMLFIINSKYAVFLGILCDNPYPGYKEVIINCSEDFFINRYFEIFIEDIVYDEDLKYSKNELIESLNNLFGYPFVQGCEVCQYFERSNKNKYSKYYSNDEYLRKHLLLYDNNDKFHSIATKINKKFNLYKLLEKNQCSQTIENNYDIEKVIKLFNEIMKKLKRNLNVYLLKKYQISKWENVLVLEDSVVIYVGIKGINSLFRDKNKKNNFFERYELIIQELTYNSLFKPKEFSKIFSEIRLIKTSKNSDEYLSIAYRPFTTGNPNERIMNSYHPRITMKSNFEYVDRKLPNLQLKKRYALWKGFLYYYIVYELKYDKCIGLAVTRTNDSRPNYMGRVLLKEYEHCKTRSYNSFSFNKNWFKNIEKLEDEAKRNNWQNIKRNIDSYSLLAEKVYYYVVPVYIKDKNRLFMMQEEILKKAEKNINKNFDRQLYDLIDYKWKSEELMYECIKKVFKKNFVEHQYRPFFLHSNKGQLSYDVFVHGKNIAFEYQGKQHFEPIKIFGGSDNFYKQKNRDRIKKKLSDENNVKLIYINYWENISVNLIIEKLKQCGIKKC